MIQPTRATSVRAFIAFLIVWVTCSQSTYVFLTFGNDSRPTPRERSRIYRFSECVGRIFWKPMYSYCLVLILCTRPANVDALIAFRMFLQYFRVPEPPRSVKPTKKRGLDFLVFFSVERYTPKPLFFHFGVISGLLFDPGDGLKTKK